MDDGLILDISAGPRELKLGTGMLIANGGASGFQRGALKFGPRKAWEMAGVVSLHRDPTSLPAYENSPPPSNRGSTHIRIRRSTYTDRLSRAGQCTQAS